MGRKRPPVPEARGPSGSPTVRRRELGSLLRALRNARGLTVEQVAGELLCSPSKVSRMETGQRGATARDIRDICELYGVTDPAERERLATLAAEGKKQGWWQSYELADDFTTYVGLEQAATSMKHFACLTVMGLVETPAYARAMHVAGYERFTPERIEELVEVRMRRQQLLDRQPPLRLHLVFDEAVLHRVVGGPAVMAEQLDRLVKISKSPDITIQVIPSSSGAHPAMDSNFTILEFDNTAPSVVYVEGLVGWLYLERQQDLSRYGLAFERLCNMALSPKDSVELIRGIATVYSTQRSPEGDLTRPLIKTPGVRQEANNQNHGLCRGIIMRGDDVQPLNWRKALRSMSNGACVEVAATSAGVAIRDSKDVDGEVLRYPANSWLHFVADARKGRFDVQGQ
jgi:transcriptional regulator with XRE-family HTH domain